MTVREQVNGLPRWAKVAAVIIPIALSALSGLAGASVTLWRVAGDERERAVVERSIPPAVDSLRGIVISGRIRAGALEARVTATEAEVAQFADFRRALGAIADSIRAARDSQERFRCWYEADQGRRDPFDCRNLP